MTLLAGVIGSAPEYLTKEPGHELDARFFVPTLRFWLHTAEGWVGVIIEGGAATRLSKRGVPSRGWPVVTALGVGVHVRMLGSMRFGFFRGRRVIREAGQDPAPDDVPDTPWPPVSRSPLAIDVPRSRGRFA